MFRLACSQGHSCFTTSSLVLRKMQACIQKFYLLRVTTLASFSRLKFIDFDLQKGIEKEPGVFV